MKRTLKARCLFLCLVFSLFGCQTIMSVSGKKNTENNAIWLSHEHILVDFIGADKISQDDYDHDVVINAMLPYLNKLKKHKVKYFVDATPQFLGRDPRLLKSLSEASGINIITNTGLYGARQNKFIPEYAYNLSADELAEKWIMEFEKGIGKTGIRPGFIKISVDASDQLDPMHEKIVRAAARTHLATGLTIASHTGKAIGLWPQLKILQEEGVSPSAFIWVHAQNETDADAYIRAANTGCWISLDGLGWKTDIYVQKLKQAKESKYLDQVLISHDAGWFDPQKKEQSIKPYTNIFLELIPELEKGGFSRNDIRSLLSANPANAFKIKVRKIN